MTGFLSQTFSVFLYGVYMGLRIAFCVWDQMEVQNDRCEKIIVCIYHFAVSVVTWFLINLKFLRLNLAMLITFFYLFLKGQLRVNDYPKIFKI